MTEYRLGLTTKQTARRQRLDIPDLFGFGARELASRLEDGIASRLTDLAFLFTFWVILFAALIPKKRLGMFREDGFVGSLFGYGDSDVEPRASIEDNALVLTDVRPCCSL